MVTCWMLIRNFFLHSPWRSQQSSALQRRSFNGNIFFLPSNKSVAFIPTWLVMVVDINGNCLYFKCQLKGVFEGCSYPLLCYIHHHHQQQKPHVSDVRPHISDLMWGSVLISASQNQLKCLLGENVQKLSFNVLFF